MVPGRSQTGKKARLSGKYGAVTFLTYHSATKPYQQEEPVRELTDMQGGCFDNNNQLHSQMKF